MESAIILGAGGHGAVILDILEECGQVKVEGFINIYENELKLFLGYPILGNPKDLSILSKVDVIYYGIGDNYKRYIWVNNIKSLFPHIKFYNAIHPKSIVSKKAILGEGSIISAAAIIQCCAEIKNFTIVNTSAILEHNSILGNFSSLAPNSCTGGNVKIGDYTAIGLNTTILQKIEIGSQTIIGAGSVVTKNVPDNVIAYGAPCKIIRNKSKDENYL